MKENLFPFVVFGFVWICGFFVFALSPYYLILRKYGYKDKKLKSLLLKHFFFGIYMKISFESLKNFSENELLYIREKLSRRVKNIIIYIFISALIGYSFL